jgi:hypothetical protein
VSATARAGSNLAQTTVSGREKYLAQDIASGIFLLPIKGTACGCGGNSIQDGVYCSIFFFGCLFAREPFAQLSQPDFHGPRQRLFIFQPHAISSPNRALLHRFSEGLR